MSAFLDPAQKNLFPILGISPEEMEECKANILEMTNLFKDNSANNKENDIDNDNQLCFKKIRYSQLNNIKTTTTQSMTKRQQLKNEIKEYEDLSYTGCESALEFWRSHKLQFPMLAHIVRYVYCIPASSSKSEEDFSDCGFTKSP